MTGLLAVRDLEVRFAQRRSLLDLAMRRPEKEVRAVAGVSFALGLGETLGIVGESGCGKTTLGRAILGLVKRSAGDILFDGESIDAVTREHRLAFRRGAQMVFQDPLASLNPKMTASETLAEVLRVHDLCPPEHIAGRIAGLLDTVGLSAELAHRRPRALSGGQCQRVGIARALAAEPRLIVADEPVSALDVSVQAQILNLLTRLQQERGLAMVLISHDLSVVRHICQSVAVMYLGRIVEVGPTTEVFAAPRHPYTQALLASKPRIDGPGLEETGLLQGEPPSPLDVPDGCAFHPRCSHAMAICRAGPQPVVRSLGPVRVACHLYADTSQEIPAERVQADGDRPKAREISSAVRETMGASRMRT